MAKQINNLRVGVTVKYAGMRIDGESSYIIPDDELKRFQDDQKLLNDLSAAIPETTITDTNKPTQSFDQVQSLRFLFDLQVQDSDGKQIVHSTARKYGLYTYFSGRDDDNADDYDVGNGSTLMAAEMLGAGPLIVSKEFHINGIENETHIHKGFLQWCDAKNDVISMAIVPKVTTYSAGTNTGYNLFGGYLIIPAAGDGLITVNDADRFLVEVPIGEHGERIGAGYWDAEWNTLTKQFDNIVPNLTGEGQFNMFGLQVTLNRFVNEQPVLGDNVMHMETNDASMLGHNSIIKVTAETLGTPRDWCWNASIVLYRKKTS